MTSLQSQRQLLKSQKETQKRKRITTVIIAILIVVAALLLLYFLPRKKMVGPSIGDPEAPVKVEQFSNYTCSHCRNFALQNEDIFKETYIDTGKVFLTYYNFQFEIDESANAAEATYCAGDQGKFFEFKRQVYLNNQSSNAYTEESLLNYGKTVGLNMDEFQQCLASDKHVSSVTDARSYAQMQHVKYTPSFMVNGKLVLSNELIDTVEAALAEAGK